MNAKKETDSAAKEPAGAEFNFEKAYARLEAIVASLDEGNLPLDELLARFEEGIQLAKACGKRLDEVEHRVQILVQDEDGTERLEDFEAEDEN